MAKAAAPFGWDETKEGDFEQGGALTYEDEFDACDLDGDDGVIFSAATSRHWRGGGGGAPPGGQN